MHVLNVLAGMEPRRHGGITPGLEKAMEDPRVAAALNAALNAPNRMAGELYKLKNTHRH